MRASFFAGGAGLCCFSLQRPTRFNCSIIKIVSVSIVRGRSDDQTEEEKRAADFERIVAAALFVAAVMTRRFGPVMVLRLRRRLVMELRRWRIAMRCLRTVFVRLGSWVAVRRLRSWFV